MLSQLSFNSLDAQDQDPAHDGKELLFPPEHLTLRLNFCRTIRLNQSDLLMCLMDRRFVLVAG